MKSYLDKLQELKQMVQFGPGTTFAELMKQFREIGDGLTEAWPWVPFDASGDIKCTIIPTIEADGFELILVRVEKASRFPAQAGQGFIISNVTQHVIGIEGTLIIEKGRYNDIVTAGVSKTITAGEACALNYGPGLYLFKQSPSIAEAEDFQFVTL